MLVFPNAKINIGLNILNRRSDGFHEIESILLPIPFRDVLEGIQSDSFKMTTSGIPIPGNPESNLCVKAFHLLRQDFRIPPVHIHLHKVIPMGAGLGGGSADGAFTLRLLNDLFDLKIASENLEHYASQLGSDCPFFIQNKPSLATGTGTTLEPIHISLEGYQLALVTPEVHVSTENAYGNSRPRPAERELLQSSSEPISHWKNRISNQFEESVFPLFPVLESIKKELYKAGAAYASLTGSGASLYGIFERRTDLKTIDSPVYWMNL